MLKYPLDPSHARILIAAFEYGCPSEAIDVLSLLNSGPIFIDQSSKREEATEARKKYIDKEGDHMTALAVFRDFEEIKSTSNRAAITWAKETHVNLKSLLQAVKIRDQLRDLATRFGQDWRASSNDTKDSKVGAVTGIKGDNSVVIRALLQGLFMNTAVIQADGTYRQTAGSLVSRSLAVLGPH
jgi:ATP-dependent RNA helicase DHX33